MGKLYVKNHTSKILAIIAVLMSTTVGLQSADAAVTAPSATWSAPASPSNASTLTYTLTFSTSVSGIETKDFSNAGTATGCIFTPSLGTGVMVTVTATGCSEGTVIARLAAKSVAAGMILGPLSATTSLPVTIDRTPPTVVGLTTPVAVTKSDSINYALQISESVTGVGGSDFSNTGTATGCAFNTTSSSGKTFTLTVTSCSEGTLIVQLADHSIQDLAGNAGPAASFSASSITIDKTKPTQSWTTIPSSPHNNIVMMYTLDFSEGVLISDITASRFSNQGTAAGCKFYVPVNSTIQFQRTANIYVSNCTSGSLIVRFNPVGVKDQAGNIETTPSIPLDTDSINVDPVPPSLVWASIPASPSNATALNYSIRFPENVTGLDVSDFAFSGTAKNCVASVDADSGSFFNITVTGCSEGIVILGVKKNAVIDAAKNPGPTAASLAAARVIDRTAPSATWGTCSTTACTLTFSEPVSGLDSSDFAFAGTSSNWMLNSLAVAATGTTAAIRYSSSSTSTTGTMAWKLSSNTVADAAGNVGPANDIQSKPLSYTKR